MGRQIAVQTEGVCTAIELAQALKRTDRAGRVEPGRAHEQDAKFVGFELFILRVGALQGDAGRGGSIAARDSCRNR